MEEKLNTVQEEKLCELVQQYPVIYDKSHKGYKEKDVELNAWEEIASALEFISTGEMAQNCFTKVKRRYLAKRLELKKVDKSGTSSAVVEKARKDVNAYSFLFWIDDFLKPRRTKCNVPESIPSLSADEEESLEYPENGTLDFNNDVLEDEESSAKKVPKLKSTEYDKKAKRSKTSSLEERHLSILNRIDEELKEDQGPKEEKDEEYFYAQTIAAALRKHGDMERCMIKHEINNILFRYEMNMYRSQNRNYHSPSQTAVHPTPQTPTGFSAATSNSSFNWQHTNAHFQQYSPQGYTSHAQSNDNFERN